jgi:DNA-binding CsgD family transcriptional regulator
MMSENPAERLTDAQLACVRMVGTGPSKVIAKRLGLSPHTVDNHIKAAMQRLGASTRHEAMDIVASWDNAGPDQDLVSQPGRIAVPPEYGNLDPSFRPPAGGTADSVREVPVVFGASEPALYSPAMLGDARNVVRSPFQTIARIAAIAVSIAIIASAALPISQGFQAIANLVQPYSH